MIELFKCPYCNKYSDPENMTTAEWDSGNSVDPPEIWGITPCCIKKIDQDSIELIDYEISDIASILNQMEQ